MSLIEFVDKNSFGLWLLAILMVPMIVNGVVRLFRGECDCDHDDS